MNKPQDSIDLDLASSGDQPGFPRPCDPRLLPNLLQIRQQYVDAGLIPPLPAEWKPGIVIKRSAPPSNSEVELPIRENELTTRIPPSADLR